MTNLTSSSTAHQAHKVVFSPFSDFAYIPKDECQPKWYSPQEKKRFYRTLISDTRRIKHTLKEQGTSASTTTAEHLHEYIELDKLINHDVMVDIAKKRRSHIDSILSEQKTQREQGVYDLERLSRVSRESSDWTCGKAHKLALAYSELC